MNSVKCYLCDKFYETKRKLNVHIRNTHSEKVSCKVCSKEFSNSSNAEKHARTVHDGLLVLCPCCLKECQGCQTWLFWVQIGSRLLQNDQNF